VGLYVAINRPILYIVYSLFLFISASVLVYGIFVCMYDDDNDN